MTEVTIDRSSVLNLQKENSITKILKNVSYEGIFKTVNIFDKIDESSHRASEKTTVSTTKENKNHSNIDYLTPSMAKGKPRIDFKMLQISSKKPKAKREVQDSDYCEEKVCKPKSMMDSPKRRSSQICFDKNKIDPMIVCGQQTFSVVGKR